MPQMPRLRVPVPHRAAIRGLSALPDDTYKGLIGVFEEQQPALDIDVMVDRLGGVLPGMSSAEQASLLEALLSLRTTVDAHEYPVADVGQAVSDAPELDLGDDADRQSLLAARISECLAAPAIRTLAKVSEITGAYPNVLHSARVITDIRPVFADKVEDPPIGSILLHTLSIEYFSAAGVRTFQVLMDGRDLSMLRTAIDREFAKAKTVRAQLKDSGMQVHEPEEH